MNRAKYITALTLCAATVGVAEAAKKQPNVILIMTDDMGYSDLGCYGNTSNHTPNMDRLAAEGVRFTDFHSNGTVSSPTRAALMTGGYQQWTGVEGVITAADHREVGMPHSEVTIAEVLKEGGYKTAIFGKWHLGYPAEFSPIYQGFDVFKGYVSGNVDYFSHIDQAGFIDWWNGDKLEADEGYTTDLITDYAIDYISTESGDDKPYFLYLPYEACHGPFQAPDEEEAIRSINEDGKMVARSRGKVDSKAIYKKMVESLDQNIGRLMATLEESGEADNTMIILFSDNGGTATTSNAPLSGYKAQVLEGGHRVFSIIKYPGKVKAGVVCDETTMSMDIMPTICEAANVSMKGFDREGVSLWKLLTKGKSLESRDLFWRFMGNKAVRRGDWKLIVDKDGKTKRLFNLADDISEKSNLVEKYPEMVADLTVAIIQWESQFDEVKSVSK